MTVFGYRPLKSNSNDLSGNGNNGTDGTGVTYLSTGPLGGCADFATAKTSYIDCGAGSSLYISPTICSSGRFNQEDSTAYTLCSRGGASVNNQYHINTNREGHLLYVYTITDSGATAGSLYQSGPTLSTGTWYYYSRYRITTGEQFFFVNGVPQTNKDNVFTNGTGAIYNESNPKFWIGRTSTNNSGYEGQIAGLEIGNFVITPAYHKNKYARYKGFI